MPKSQIGVFDSGLGGLSVLRALQKTLRYSFVYLGDNARAPYGGLDAQTIYTYTKQAVEHLFLDHDCQLVILACNSASTVVLRRLQQEWLQKKYPERRVLGIHIPTIEKVTGVDWETGRKEGQAFSSIGIFATEATVSSGVYESEILKRTPEAKVISIACPDLVPLIERGAAQEVIDSAVNKYVKLMRQASKRQLGRALPEAILLGCTHYSLIAHRIQKELGKGTKLFDQPQHIADSTGQYLKNHPEIVKNLNTAGDTILETTADAQKVSDLAGQEFKTIPLP